MVTIKNKLLTFRIGNAVSNTLREISLIKPPNHYLSPPLTIDSYIDLK